MHIVGRSPQKANESALECNAQLTVHNGLIYEICQKLKVIRMSVVGVKNFKPELKLIAEVA